MSDKRKEDEILCRKVAEIMGQSSSAQQALDKLQELRQQGKKAWVESVPSMWSVSHE